MFRKLTLMVLVALALVGASTLAPQADAQPAPTAQQMEAHWCVFWRHNHTGLVSFGGRHYHRHHAEQEAQQIRNTGHHAWVEWR